jgi:P4 family phage/plasmid primase-like protien
LLPSWKRYQTERPTEGQVREWWTQWTDAWIGLALGEVSGVVRIDAEGDWQANVPGEMPATMEFTTPSGGRGWLYPYSHGVETEVLWKGKDAHEELRVQAAGAYCVLPPSPGYKWVNTALAKKPLQWLYSRGVVRAVRELERQMNPLIASPDDVTLRDAVAHLAEWRADNYDDWIRVGFALHSAGDQYLPLWEEFSKRSEKFAQGECERLWNGFRRGGRLTFRSLIHWAREDDSSWKPAGYFEPLSEQGNANILARVGQGSFMHSSAWGWLAYKDGVWTKGGDAEKAVQEKQKDLLDERLRIAQKSLARHVVSDPNAKDYHAKVKSKTQAVKAIKSFQEERKFKGARALAASDPKLSTDYRAFDQHPHLLNCINGTVDLRTGVLKPHDPADLLTQMCPTEYHPDAICPLWDRTLNEVFRGDDVLVGWLQKYLGYCATGSTIEDVLVIFHGSGRNGKTTILDTVVGVLGPDYACPAPPKFVTTTKREEHPTKYAAVRGKRLVVDSESDKNGRLDEGAVKRMTGGSGSQDRGMYENYQVTKTQHKMLLDTNHAPMVSNPDEPCWERIVLVPFAVCFQGEHKNFDGETNLHLEEDLKVESSGILRRIIEGAVRWNAEGLGRPPAVREATREYKEMQNPVARFLKECFDRATEGKVEKATVLDAWRQWCADEAASGRKVEHCTDKAFGQAVAKLGIKKDSRYYLGLKAKSEESGTE